MRRYLPAKGDIVVLSLDPQSGHEQKGRRPALVVSNTQFNRATGLAMVCPLTSADRGIPFHVPVADCPAVSGFVMAEQVKSVDFAARHARRLAAAPPALLYAVLAVLDACLF